MDAAGEPTAEIAEETPSEPETVLVEAETAISEMEEVTAIPEFISVLTPEDVMNILAGRMAAQPEKVIALEEKPAERAEVTTGDTAVKPAPSEVTPDESVEPLLSSEETEPAPAPFTPSDATVWIVKNSMPVLVQPEVLVAPQEFTGGDPVFVSPVDFRDTAQEKRKEAVDALFDSLQF